MNLPAAIAQGIWAAGNLADAARFARALQNPEKVQSGWLMRRLASDAGTAFGREHDFGSIRNYRDFTRLVPMRDWHGFSPWIDRIRAGEQAVLGAEPVRHLVPTSGSSGARKLIPFTRSLHRSFGAAVAAWMTDLTLLEPGLLGGPAYWSISPLADDGAEEEGVVPVGFADDAEYLGGWKAGLARHAMAIPAELRHERDIDVFWRRTASGLLAQSDLRLISVWHPSFLGLIIEAAERDWDGILSALGGRRAAELRRVGPQNAAGWWPKLRVVSCWGDLAAESGMRELERRFPGCGIQPKGLLATEAVVTIPWRGMYPLAVCSHFFEFLSDGGDVLLAHQLERGKAYEVLVSNGGGLWRYRLGDLVECSGRCGGTPTLRFLGRAGNVSDLCGEKLSEAFVAEAIAAVWPDASGRPAIAYLRPLPAVDGVAGYGLVVATAVDESLPGALDDYLRGNPHYDLARKLGQLQPVRMLVEADAGNLINKRDARRIGDIKPMVLDSAPVVSVR